MGIKNNNIMLYIHTAGDTRNKSWVKLQKITFIEIQVGLSYNCYQLESRTIEQRPVASKCSYQF